MFFFIIVVVTKLSECPRALLFSYSECLNILAEYLMTALSAAPSPSADSSLVFFSSITQTIYSNIELLQSSGAYI